VRRVLWFALEPPTERAAQRAPPAPARPPPAPRPEKIGFLEQQRQKKVARAARRAAAKK
jgi:hypothetical protein